MNKINRSMGKEVLAMSNCYPVVTIIGPRQSGKTTLAKMLFPNKSYVSLENPDERMLAQEDPRRFFERFPKGAIIDEIQRLPALLSYIQEIVDISDKKGVFILTGSNQLALCESIAQSLAGRTAILKLLPLTLDELRTINHEKNIDEIIFNGMYPGVHANKIDSTKFYRNYIATYVERDVRNMVDIKNLNIFQKFLKLCAGRVGQILNISSLANDIGISHTTVNNWISILEASFVVYRLFPYYENFGKRIIKMPKLYFTDSGLARYLLGIFTIEQISRDPLRGNLFENFIITELIKHQFNRGKEDNFYFYRDSNNNEADIVFNEGVDFFGIEIKSGQTFNSEFLKGLKKIQTITAERFKRGYIIYTGKQEQKIENYNLINFASLKKIFE